MKPTARGIQELMKLLPASPGGLPQQAAALIKSEAQ
jgi:hypothetical protein